MCITQNEGACHQLNVYFLKAETHVYIDQSLTMKMRKMPLRMVETQDERNSS